MTLTPKEVRKIANLARLDLSEEEVTQFSSQLSSILAFVEKLNELDVSKIEPTAHAVSVATPFREDEAISFKDQEEVLEAAPDRDGRFFKVPKVI